MKIGFLSEAVPYLPCREGFRIYGANVIRCLSRRHQLDLIALAAPEDRRHLHWARPYVGSLATVDVGGHHSLARVANVVGGYFLGRPWHYRAAIAGHVGVPGRWDVLHVEGPFMGGLVADSPLAKVLSVHDSTTMRWREVARLAGTRRERVHARLMALYARRYERLVYPRFDYCVVVTEKEREALARIAPRARIEVVGNGTDTSYFSPQPPQDRETASLVFHGNLAYPPNVAGAVEFADRVLPLIRAKCPHATFHLVGAEPGPEVRQLLSRPGIRLSADVADVRPYLASADVYVCGIRHAGGIKNKLLEAMAMALPVVTYAPATSGIDCVPGTHLLVAQAPAEFAQRVLELLDASERARALGDRARRLMVEHYSWESRASAFERLYEAAINARPGRGGRADIMSTAR